MVRGVFIIFSLYFFFLKFFLNATAKEVCIFIPWLYLSLGVAHFILCIFCGPLSLHFEKRKKHQTSETVNRLTGTALVVSYFQTARQDRIIRLRTTEVIVPYIQSFFNLSIFFLVSPFIKAWWMTAALWSSPPMLLQNSLTCVHSSPTSFSFCYMSADFCLASFPFSCAFFFALIFGFDCFNFMFPFSFSISFVEQMWEVSSLC